MTVLLQVLMGSVSSFSTTLVYESTCKKFGSSHALASSCLKRSFNSIDARNNHQLLRPITALKEQQENSDEDSNTKEEGANPTSTVPLGSEDYYKGFLTRSLDEEPLDRVSGDALLGPTFKFVGGFAVVLGGLFLAFMASNGLI